MHPAPISAMVASGKFVPGIDGAGTALVSVAATAPDERTCDPAEMPGQTGQVAGARTFGQDKDAVPDSCAAPFAGTIANSENPGDRAE